VVGATGSCLERVHGGEIGRASGARHVGISGGINGDAVAIIPAAAAQVGGVDQGRAGGIQLRHERSVIPHGLVERLKRVRGGEVGRISPTCHVGVAGGIDGDAVAFVITTAAQVGGVDQG